MRELDSILLEAWVKMGALARKNRIEALKRSQRRFSKALTQPMREWCLVIRASDTRISNRAYIDPPDAIENFQPHIVTLSGAVIRELTKPVDIPWPGVTYHEAAKLTGREYQSLHNWVKRGVFRVDHYRQFGFPELRERGGKRGGRPFIWTPSPIDPNNFTGRPPHPIWGTLWQYLRKELPEDYELVVQRVPRFRPHARNPKTNQMPRSPRYADKKFAGWEFVCPGRLDRDGNYQGCGKRCTYLYGPQSVWTLGRAFGAPALDMPEDSGLAGQWFPGLADPICATGPRSFACKKCWGVRSAAMTSPIGWNDFIAHVSGGLLYGREVPRPLHLYPIERKKRPFKRRTRAELAAARAAAAEAEAQQVAQTPNRPAAAG